MQSAVKVKNFEIYDIRAFLIFLIDRASIYDRKTAARRFDAIYDNLRSLSIVLSLFKGKNAPI